MEFQQLRHLIAAAESGNLLKASQICCISQSGLSRSIKQLEDRLGVQLLIRGPRGVEPTESGIAVINRARVILNEVARAGEDVRDIVDGRIGEVRLGITQNFTRYLVPDLLAHIRNERPNLAFDVRADGFHELVEAVKAEAIEFGFGVIGQLGRTEGIVIEELSSHGSRVMCAANHPLAKAGKASLEDLHQAQWAMLGTEGVQRPFQIFFESRGLTPPCQSLKATSVEFIRQWLETGQFLTVLPAPAMQKELDSGRFVVLDCQGPFSVLRVGLFYRSRGLLSQQARIVIEAFRKNRGLGIVPVAYGAPTPMVQLGSASR